MIHLPGTTHDCGRPRPRLKLQRPRLTTTTASASKEISQLYPAPYRTLKPPLSQSADSASMPVFCGGWDSSPSHVQIIQTNVAVCLTPTSYIMDVPLGFSAW